jgi:hypothetical protein
MDHDGGDTESLMCVRLHSSTSKEAAVFFIQIIRPTKLPFIQAAENVKKYNRRIYYLS